MTQFYQHYKTGTVYRVFSAAARAEADGPEGPAQVVYYNAAQAKPQVWVRPADEFFGEVEHNGKRVLRFAPVAF